MKLKMSSSEELNDITELIKSAEEMIEQNRVRMRKFSSRAKNIASTSSLFDDTCRTVEEFLRTTENVSNQRNSEVVESNNDDDVIFVRSEPLPGPAVINLCTPISTRRRKRSAAPISNVEPVTIEESITEVPQQKRVNTTPTPNSSQGSEGLICPICLESVISRNPMSTVCGHIFCRNCITSAIKIAKRCPLCKKKNLTTKLIHPIYLH